MASHATPIDQRVCPLPLNVSQLDPIWGYQVTQRPNNTVQVCKSNWQKGGNILEFHVMYVSPTLISLLQTSTEGTITHSNKMASTNTLVSKLTPTLHLSCFLATQRNDVNVAMLCGQATPSQACPVWTSHAHPGIPQLKISTDQEKSLQKPQVWIRTRWIRSPLLSSADKMACLLH